MAQLFLNNFETVFIASVKDAPTTGAPATELDYGILRVSDGASGSLINPTGGDYYILTAFKRSGTVESNVEVMRVTAVNNSVPGECRITVLRGQEGTTPQAYVSGDRIALRFTKGGAENFLQPNDTRLPTSLPPSGGAGGVLSGSYPNPGFAVDMATQAELDAHTGATTGAHAASAISNTPAGNIAATTVQAAINELDTEKQAVLVSGTNIKTLNGSSILGSGDLVLQGGINYTRHTANVTAADKSGIIADTTAGSFTVTLPASPSIGTQVSIVDGGNWATNNLTVGRNGQTIEGAAEDLVMDIGGSSAHLIFDGTTWEVYVQIGANTGGGVALLTQTFSGTGSQTAFTLGSAPGSLNALEVFVSGVRQISGTHYTLSGTTLTFVTAPPAGTNNIFTRWIGTQSVVTVPDQAVTQAKLEPGFDATLVKTNTAQTITGAKRGAITTNANLTFDMNVANNFTRTTATNGTLTFTNITAGQSGFILLVNSSNHTISAAATTKITATDLTRISATGTYLISYFSNGTNVFCAASGNVA